MVSNPTALEVLSDAWLRTSGSLLSGATDFVIKLILAVLIVILGWVIGALISKAIAQVIKAVKVDKALEVAGAKELARKGGFELNSGVFLGELVKWFVIVVSFVAAFDLLGLRDVNQFLEGVVLAYIPQVIAAVLILLVAVVVASALQKTVIASAKAAGFSNASLLGAVTKWSIWIFAFLAALFQLNIAATFIQTLFTGFIVALSLALGLAFGLGGRDAAKDYVEKLRKEVRDRD
jgi:hypothetical protein